MNKLEVLSNTIKARDWEKLDSYIKGLNSNGFKSLQTEVRTKILPQYDNEMFWNSLSHLIIFKKQAFLACSVAVEGLAKNGTLDFNNEHVKALSDYLHANYPDAIIRMMNLMMPFLTNEKQVRDMFTAFDLDNRTRIAVLLTQHTPTNYYLLFEALAHQHEDKVLIKKCCMLLANRGDDMSLNMACILKEYFDISDVNIPKSIHIEQYELSHLERNKENFINALHGKRPKI